VAPAPIEETLKLSPYVQNALVYGDNKLYNVALIVANFEARLRSPFYPELIQYTLFADAGDVWQRDRAIGGNQHKASSLWLNALKWTPGIGVRVFTPVGPFQANVGYNPYAQPPGAIYFDASAAKTKCTLALSRATAHPEGAKSMPVG